MGRLYFIIIIIIISGLSIIIKPSSSLTCSSFEPRLIQVDRTEIIVDGAEQMIDEEDGRDDDCRCIKQAGFVLFNYRRTGKWRLDECN